MQSSRKLFVRASAFAVGLLVSLAAWAAGFTNPVVSSDKSNTAGGSGVLVNVEVSTGTNNTGFGAQVLAGTTTGNYNTAIGAAALDDNTTGAGNTGLGYNALGGNTDGSFNTAVGLSALSGNTTGQLNAALGTSTLEKNTTGNNNTANGDGALRFNQAGNANSAVGRQALYKSAGSGNTGVGFQSLLNMTSGNNNIAIGQNAGNALTSGSSNIYIGNPGGASETNVTRIGNTQSKAFIAGIAGVSVSNAVQVVVDSSTGQLGIFGPSSERYKDDVRDMADQGERLHKLRPVTFRYKADGAKARQYGLVAEEVAEVYPDLVVRNGKGEIENVQYPKLIPLLLKQIQVQQNQIARLEARMQQMEARGTSAEHLAKR